MGAWADGIGYLIDGGTGAGLARWSVSDHRGVVGLAMGVSCLEGWEESGVVREGRARRRPAVRLTGPGHFRPASITELLDLAIDMLLNASVLRVQGRQFLAIVSLGTPGSKQEGAQASASSCLNALINAYAKLGVIVDLEALKDHTLIKHLDDETLIEHHRMLGAPPPDPSPIEAPRV